jgi:acetolactate synthase-1/3 small subunit
MRHTINVLVENEFGVLARVAALFSGRGFNIESLSVAETLDPSMSSMTIVTRGDDQVLEQITKQLNKLVSVIKVETRAEILSITDIFRGKVVDVGPKSYSIEVTGDVEKVKAFLELLKPMGIKEVARTGQVALVRG